MASSILKSGKIPEKLFDNIVFQLQGGHSIIILCHQAAAISRALFA
jgi:hypothetical protein